MNPTQSDTFWGVLSCAEDTKSVAETLKEEMGEDTRIVFNGLSGSREPPYEKPLIILGGDVAIKNVQKEDASGVYAAQARGLLTPEAVRAIETRFLFNASPRPFDEICVHLFSKLNSDRIHSKRPPKITYLEMVNARILDYLGQSSYTLVLTFVGYNNTIVWANNESPLIFFATEDTLFWASSIELVYKVVNAVIPQRETRVPYTCHSSSVILLHTKYLMSMLQHKNMISSIFPYIKKRVIKNVN